MKALVSFVSGIIFAIGLVISGMTNPKVVIGFLDIFREWNYSLIFVMGGAVLINLVVYKFILSRKPLLEEKHSLPLLKKTDKKLLLGSTLFGIGWGLLGICPGPGIVNLVTFSSSAFIFIFSMFMGMLLFKLISKK